MVNTFFPSVAASPDGHHVFVAWAAQTWKPPGTAPGAGVVSQFAAYNLRTNGAWSGGHVLSSASGDPARDESRAVAMSIAPLALFERRHR